MERVERSNEIVSSKLKVAALKAHKKLNESSRELARTSQNHSAEVSKFKNLLTRANFGKLVQGKSANIQQRQESLELLKQGQSKLRLAFEGLVTGKANQQRAAQNLKIAQTILKNHNEKVATISAQAKSLKSSLAQEELTQLAAAARSVQSNESMLAQNNPSGMLMVPATLSNFPEVKAPAQSQDGARDWNTQLDQQRQQLLMTGQTSANSEMSLAIATQSGQANLACSLASDQTINISLELPQAINLSKLQEVNSEISTGLSTGAGRYVFNQSTRRSR